MGTSKKTLERENEELRNQVESLLKTIDTFRTRFETLGRLFSEIKGVYETRIKNLEEELAYMNEQLNEATANEESRSARL
jgi:predicted  nucleic acid-binding Zn-ribbon protein